MKHASLMPSYADRQRFKERLRVAGLDKTGKAAKALGVSRYAVMHWKAGRRNISPIVDVALDGIIAQKHWDFLT